MNNTQTRNDAAELAKRLEVPLSECSKLDEEKRRPYDRSPGFANAVMPDAPISIESAADLNLDDWALVQTALEHYALCRHDVERG